MESASTIGRGTVVRGSVHGEGDLEILGRVEGSVSVSGELAIGETALVKSDVSGSRVIVRGAVAGNVSATESILLEAGARVVGDLGAPQIGIRPGALVRGLVSTAGPLERSASTAATAVATSRARTAPITAKAPARATVPSALTHQVSPPAPPPRPARPAPATRPAPAPAPRPRAEPHRVEEEVAPTPTHPVHTHGTDVERAEAREEDESVHEASAHREHGGPPPPVVPQIRKGAKASLRRKGAR